MKYHLMSMLCVYLEQLASLKDQNCTSDLGFPIMTYLSLSVTVHARSYGGGVQCHCVVLGYHHSLW